MICTAQPHGHRNLRNKPLGIPSSDRIRQLAEEIQSTWSPRTRARRAAEGFRRADLMVVSALEFDDTQTFCNDD